MSSLFRVIKFPFQGMIITVDQLSLVNTDSHVGNVPFIGKNPTNCENIGVYIFKDSLLGAFPTVSPPDLTAMGHINMISTIISEGHHDPWKMLDPTNLDRYDDSMPPNEIDLAYQTIQSISTITDEEGESSNDSLHDIFPSDESIMETMFSGDSL